MLIVSPSGWLVNSTAVVEVDADAQILSARPFNSSPHGSPEAMSDKAKKRSSITTIVFTLVCLIYIFSLKSIAEWLEK
jgi:hypothetical protein